MFYRDSIVGFRERLESGMIVIMIVKMVKYFMDKRIR